MCYLFSPNSHGREMVLIFHIGEIQFLIGLKRIIIHFPSLIILPIETTESILPIVIHIRSQGYRNIYFKFNQNTTTLCR